MKRNNFNVEQSNRILRLSPDQIRDPAALITEFFLTYHLKDIREILWEWLWVGLANSNDHFPTAIDRSNLLFLYENLEKLIEANYILSKRTARKKRKRMRIKNQAPAANSSAN